MFIHSGPWCLWPISWKPFDFRAVRWSAVWAWIVVATLFQTCFRPPKMNAWCWWIRVYIFGSLTLRSLSTVLDAGSSLGCLTSIVAVAFRPVFRHNGTRVAYTCPGKTYMSFRGTWSRPCAIVSEYGCKGNSDNSCETPMSSTSVKPVGRLLRVRDPRCTRGYTSTMHWFSRVWNRSETMSADDNSMIPHAPPSRPTAVRTSNPRRQRGAILQEN